MLWLVFSGQQDGKSRDDQIGVDVVTELPYAPSYRSHFHSHTYTSRGSVITPAIADAATVAGDGMNTSAEGLPMRPLKFRVDAVMHTSPSPSPPICPPKHAPHVELVTTAPASIRVST